MSGMVSSALAASMTRPMARLMDLRRKSSRHSHRPASTRKKIARP